MNSFVSRVGSHARDIVAAGLLFSALGLCSASAADGTFISAPDRVDIAYDDAHGVLYISGGPKLLRYEVSSGKFLQPLKLGGQTAGMDVSPDGATLAVANFAHKDTNNWIHLVDLNALTVTKVKFALADYEGGTFTAAYGNDGKLLVSSMFEGSGWVPLRLYDPATKQTSTIASVRQDSMLSSSADRSVIGLEESNISSGPFGRYRVSDGNFAENGGTGWFTYEIGVSRNAKIYAIPTYGGTYIADADLNLTGTVIGEYAGGQPVAAAFHPTRNLVYFPWAGSTTVKVYNTKTWTEVRDYDAGSTFGSNGNYAFVNGRAKLSRDGALLFVTVANGVQAISTVK